MSGALGILTEPDVRVPMRDGARMEAHVFRPDAGGPLPAILHRTPYGRRRDGYERYVRAGYAVVSMDSRGRYGSEGDWVPFTVEHTGDAEDGYDSVEWLAAQPWCDGRVGTLGASYDAWMQWQLARLRPPHLAAMCAYTIPLELTEVDWPGAFRPGRRIKWWLTSMAPDLRRRRGLPPPHTPEQARRAWDEVAGEGHWTEYLPWLDFPRQLPPGLAEYARDWLEHPNRRAWRLDEVHGEVEVPNLDFSGWYDHCNGSMRHLQLMQRRGRSERARSQTKLIAGPWNHPGLGSRAVAGIDFGPQAGLNLPDLIIRWFDHWLKGIDNGVDREPAVRYFVMAGRRGRWRSADTWPPAGDHAPGVPARQRRRRRLRRLRTAVHRRRATRGPRPTASTTTHATPCRPCGPEGVGSPGRRTAGGWRIARTSSATAPNPWPRRWRSPATRRPCSSSAPRRRTRTSSPGWWTSSPLPDAPWRCATA